MTDNALRVFHTPSLSNPTLVMGLSGWMDGGNVSTGTIDYLRIKLGALPFASIEPEGFYIMNMPGTMEQATLFRPRIQYAEGLIKEYDYPSAAFYVQPDYNLILFSGKEPHLNWDRFAEAMLSLVAGLLDAAPGGSLMVVESDERFDFALLPEPERWDVRRHRPAVVGIFEKAASGGEPRRAPGGAADERRAAERTSR